MKRLEGVDDGDFPARLVRFDPADWSDAEAYPEGRGWSSGAFWRARAAWERKHGRSLPLDAVETWPDEPFDPYSEPV